MSVGGVSGANDPMMMLMQTLMKGVQAQSDLCMDMVAVGLENTIIGEKMATAQQIIDVYA